MFIFSLLVMTDRNIYHSNLQLLAMPDHFLCPGSGEFDCEASRGGGEFELGGVGKTESEALTNKATTLLQKRYICFTKTVITF